MKNKLIALVAALALGLGLSSCNETFAPNVDFGDKTYINDYSALVQQVKNLVDKIDLLNKIIDDNYDQLVVSIDGLTQAITIQTETMDADMDRIVATLTEGFTALKTTIDYMGFSIVSAINAEGELISLKIDQNGKLIEAAILGKADELVAAINNLRLSIVERFEALDIIVSTGLAEISVKVDLSSDELIAELKSINSSLDDINTSIFDGFKALNQTIVKEGESIVYAINKNGDLLVLHLDDTGKLLSAAIKYRVDELVSALNSQTTRLADRIDALNTIVASGLAKINISGNIGDILKLMLSEINDAIKDLGEDILRGFNILGTILDENGNLVIKAINDAGEKISITIDENGNMIAIKLDAVVKSLDELVSILESASATLGEKFEALNSAIEQKLGDIKLSIDTQAESLKLAIDGVSVNLLDGFKTLNETNVSELERLIYAINSNGELISFRISNTGELICVALEGQIEALAKLIADESAKWDARVLALNSILRSRLADIEVAVGKVGEEISLNLVDLDDYLKDINLSLFCGFRMTSKTISETGDAIVEAMNDNGERLVFTINQHGELIEVALGDIVASIEELIAALESQTLSLEEKFDALTEAIAKGLCEIKVSVDKQTRTLAMTIGNVKTALFDGFRTLNETNVTELEKLIYAINDKGDLISLKIDNNGNLIADAIEGLAADLVKTVNDASAALAQRICCFNKIVESGLAQVSVKIGEVGGMLDLRLFNIDDAIRDLDGTVFDGFQAIGTTVDENGNNIVTALNGNGDKISFYLDKYGNLIKISLDGIADAIDRLIAFLEDQDNSIADKIGALQDALEDKIAEVTAAINGETGLISAALGNVSLSFLNGFATLTQKFDDLGNLIAAAINKQGEGIILKIDEKGNLINASIELGAAAICDALKDQNKSLAEKLDALNKALADGFLALNADLDAVTEAIKMNYNMLSKLDLDIDADLKALTDALRTGLDNIFDGLGTLSVKIDANGDKIVTALNQNGEAIKLQIKASGEVIEASLDDNTTALIKALKDNETSLEAKLDALGEIIKAGLGDIKVELGNLYGELKLDLGGLGDIIKEGFEGVTGGLTELKSQMNADGTAIVNAITGKGDLIQGQIDASGKLIEAAIKGNTTDLKAALEALGTSSQAVADKVDALNTTVETGLGNIEAKIDAQTGKIETGFTDLSGKLGTIGTNILNGFNGVHTDLDALKAAINGLKDQLTIDINANTEAILTLDADFKDQLGKLAAAVEKIGGDIVVAINGQKEAIVLALGPDGSIVGALNAGTAEIVAAIEGQTTSLSAILNDADSGLPAILEALGTADDDIKDILEFLKSKPDVDLSEIINLLGINNHLLTELLAISDGVYLDPKDKVKVGEDSLYNYIYITADVRNAADQSDETAEALMSLLVGKSMAEPSKKQWCKTTPTSSEEFKEHSHCFWKKVNEDKPYLKYTNVTTDVDNKSLLKMEKYYGESYWELKIHDVCSYAHIYSVQINDARDLEHYVQYYKSELTQSEAGNKAKWNKGYVDEKKGTTYMGPLVVKFVCYDKATGAYCDDPNVRVYCQIGGTNTTGSSKDISPEGKCKDGTPYPDGTYSENMPDDGYWTSKPWTSLTKVGDTAIEVFDK